MQAADILTKLQTQIGEGCEHISGVGDEFIKVPAAKWHACMHLLHNSLSFDFLRALSGIDYLQQDEIEVVAHLFSYSQRAQVVIKTRIERAAPQLASVQDIWPAANWHEREIFDLLGVNFTDHPDLRRILLPDDWQGFPLRKDYQEPEFYQGIPTRRHKPELSTNNLTESK